MGLYSDFFAPEKHRSAVSDRNAIIFALVSVAVIVVALIGGSGLLMRMLY